MTKFQPYGFSSKQVQQDTKMEIDRMREVVILLEHLAKQEENTLRMILDRLYDIGSIHLINQKLPQPWLNQFSRSIACMSKPVFRVFAVRWFHRNCPQMIADWLYTVATFQTQRAQARKAQGNQPEGQTAKIAIEDAGISAAVPTPALPPAPSVLSPASTAETPAAIAVLNQLEASQQEVLFLKSRIKWLTGIVVGLTIALGSLTVSLTKPLQLVPTPTSSTPAQRSLTTTISQTP
ncbi:hypothetical protein ACN4EG_06605 [Alkalinema pantanalense CENA528]|uniref:hypothetical protein n=1 Tax=Alkalinema pantanalense TaxID=1620705 RepID=UPI003D6F28CF